MVVKCKDFAIAIKYVKRVGKQLVFKDFDNVCYRTSNYYHENIAQSVLGDLVADGYIRVDELHLKEDF